MVPTACSSEGEIFRLLFLQALAVLSGSSSLHHMAQGNDISRNSSKAEETQMSSKFLSCCCSGTE